MGSQRVHTTERLSLSLCGSAGKESPPPPPRAQAMWGTWVRALGWEDPLEKGKATLGWWVGAYPFWPGEFHRQYSPGGRKESKTRARAPQAAAQAPNLDTTKLSLTLPYFSPPPFPPLQILQIPFLPGYAFPASQDFSVPRTSPFLPGWWSQGHPPIPAPYTAGLGDCYTRGTPHSNPNVFTVLSAPSIHFKRLESLPGH